MRNRTYGGVRGRKTKVGEKLLRFPPTRCMLGISIEQAGLRETVWLKVVPHLVAKVAPVEIDYLGKILGCY